MCIQFDLGFLFNYLFSCAKQLYRLCIRLCIMYVYWAVCLAEFVTQTDRQTDFFFEFVFFNLFFQNLFFQFFFNFFFQFLAATCSSVDTFSVCEFVSLWVCDLRRNVHKKCFFYKNIIRNDKLRKLTSEDFLNLYLRRYSESLP